MDTEVIGADVIQDNLQKEFISTGVSRRGF